SALLSFPTRRSSDLSPSTSSASPAGRKSNTGDFLLRESFGTSAAGNTPSDAESTQTTCSNGHAPSAQPDAGTATSKSCSPPNGKTDTKHSCAPCGHGSTKPQSSSVTIRSASTRSTPDQDSSNTGGRHRHPGNRLTRFESHATSSTSKATHSTH